MDNRKTALVLSGGGSRGAYEVGVWQALREMDINIDIVTGTSVGSINAAMIMQDAFDLALDLWQQIETDMIFDVELDSTLKHKLTLPIEIGGKVSAEAMAYAKEILKNGGASSTGLQSILNKYLNEDTIRSSSKEFGLVTVEVPAFTPHLRFLSDIPQGQLIDYILASCACFPATKAHKIEGKDFIDGGYADNLPVGMALQKGATHIIAVNLEAVGIINKEVLDSTPNLQLIKSHWDLGNFLVFNEDNARRIIRLGYLDTMKVFGVYSGFKYAFPKGEFDKKTLKAADAAASIFELDPRKIYKSCLLDEKLNKVISEILSQINAERRYSAISSKLKALDTLSALSKNINSKTTTVLVAQHLINDPSAENILRNRGAKKIIPQEIQLAAQYILPIVRNLKTP